jgi:integrase
MATIVKRTTTAGEARYLVRLLCPDGKKRSRQFSTRRAAEDWAKVEGARMVRGDWVNPDAGKVTLETYAAEWIENRAGLRPRTVELYEGLLERHILQTLGPVDLSKITTGSVRSWHAKLSKADKPGAVTVAKAYRLLRAILNTAVEDDLITRNPCVLKNAGVERSPERRIATAEEVWALADAIDPRFRALVLTAAFTGLRWGELGGLARRHINLLHRTITVERQLVQMENGKLVLGPPKSDAGRRTIAIPDQLAAHLEDHLARYAAPGVDGLVFVGAKGASLTRGNWHVKWAAACDRAGVEGLAFHALRHTALTMAAIAGATTRDLMARAGHSSPAAALRYQHASQERDAAISAVVDELLSRPTRTSA